MANWKTPSTEALRGGYDLTADGTRRVAVNPTTNQIEVWTADGATQLSAISGARFPAFFPSAGPAVLNSVTAPFYVFKFSHITHLAATVSTALDGDLTVQLYRSGLQFVVPITLTIPSAATSASTAILPVNQQTMLPDELLTVEVSAMAATNAQDLTVTVMLDETNV